MFRIIEINGTFYSRNGPITRPTICGEGDALSRAAQIAAWRDDRSMTDGHFIGAKPPKRRPRDVFVYFDKLDKLQAPKDAHSLLVKDLKSAPKVLQAA